MNDLRGEDHTSLATQGRNQVDYFFDRADLTPTWRGTATLVSFKIGAEFGSPDRVTGHTILGQILLPILVSR